MEEAEEGLRFSSWTGEGEEQVRGEEGVEEEMKDDLLLSNTVIGDGVCARVGVEGEGENEEQVERGHGDTGLPSSCISPILTERVGDGERVRDRGCGLHDGVADNLCRNLEKAIQQSSALNPL